MTDYFSDLERAKNRVVEELERRKIAPEFLRFGGVGETRPLRAPTDARSEFLANRAMGDWAENLLVSVLAEAFPDFRFLHYGNTDKIEAGDEGFAEFYKAILEDVRVFGKRPDLLMLAHGYEVPTDVSAMGTESLRPLVASAIAAIEVRSSKYEALGYMEIRRQERQSGVRVGRATPSFTVKVEDLKIVYRWIEQFKIPQIYCQVFFDSMFAINVLKIFEIIGDGGKGYSIEKPSNNQEKATIMIPITLGSQVAEFDEIPSFELRRRVTILRRHDAYVLPAGPSVARVKFDRAKFREVASPRGANALPMPPG